MVRLAVLASALAVGALTVGPKPHRAGSPDVVTIQASEFAFTAPSTLPAGPTTFRLVNKGQQVHHLAIMRLEQGKTLADVEAAMKQPGPPPAWAVMVGGPNAASPGASVEDVVDLKPGSYLLACFVPGPDGVPHVMKGMVQELKVTEAEAKAAPAAKPDRTMKLADYGFVLSQPLTAGTHHVKVTNTATQPHELVLVRLAPDKHAKDFVDWAAGGMKTPPPGSFEGGVSPIAPGLDNTATLSLKSGRYLMVCFLDDARDGKPHFVHGMIQEFEVK